MAYQVMRLAECVKKALGWTGTLWELYLGKEMLRGAVATPIFAIY